DVITLQEVWQEGEQNQAELLAIELGLNATYRAEHSIDGGSFGNAVLSRWPIVGTDTFRYEVDGWEDENRVAVCAHIDGPRGLLDVYSTHLNWRLDHSRPRQHMVEQLRTFIGQTRSSVFPPIVGGDFNARPTSAEIRAMTASKPASQKDLVFKDAWELAGEGQLGMTWTKDNPYVDDELEPPRRIDYLFVGNPNTDSAGEVVGCRLHGTRPVDGVWPSDHFAVVADIRY
ncbi:MAG: endonuclease, partial [Actinobacteria bacterium]|nr:endonuclease [Actinomycetota bacterium]